MVHLILLVIRFSSFFSVDYVDFFVVYGNVGLDIFGAWCHGIVLVMWCLIFLGLDHCGIVLVMRQLIFLGVGRRGIVGLKCA